ncbi:hypothetical protein [Rubripirellula reticaptiva]|uniref:Uncharacterized protein n=1 Tax=Rubripirellula reticaptiva TaxID=2528013 RepID=A0A5C6ERE3_9BACT|nr:hypothetical protein [Rubripirellula reticaptiva]TWU51508.1 hypothetical protein Poly59_31000 [Rubripirellula reticaptiva]
MAKKTTKKKADAPKQTRNRTSTVSADALPRRTLEQAIRIPEVLHSTYAGKSASKKEICDTLEIGETSPNTHYLLSAAQAYGLITKEGDQFLLSETGRKIVAPTFDGEDRDAQIKAIRTPTLLSQFFTDYDGHSLPSEQHFPNVMESKFGVPRDRVDETIRLVVDNGRYVGILNEDGDGTLHLSVGGVSTVEDAADETQESIENDDTKPDYDWSKICFYITPIGEDGSDARKHSDMMLTHLIQPVANELGLKAVRADKIEKSGLISQQVFVHLVNSRLCIADLSFSNPNAFYELGVRHMTKRPTIQVIRKGDRIPFDVSQGRTITVDTSDVYTIMDRFDSARRELREHVKAIVDSGVEVAGEDNPVVTYLPGLVVKLPK